MIVLGFIIGVLIFGLIYILIENSDKYGTGWLYEKANNCDTGNLGFLHNKWAEFFQDEDYTCFMGGDVPYGLKFKYYGATWQLAGASELYWVYSEFKGISKEQPEYKSSWNYWRNDFASMKYIMENHPNLRNVRKGLKAEDKRPEIIR